MNVSGPSLVYTDGPEIALNTENNVDPVKKTENTTADASLPGVLQARINAGDARLYSVARDLAYCFPDMMREVSSRIDKKRWPEVAALLATHSSAASIELSVARLCAFVADVKRETMEESMARTQFNEVPEADKIALMALLGTVVIGNFWVAIRHASLGNPGPVLEMEDLREAGRKAADLLAK